MGGARIARDRALDRDVAIKLILAEAAAMAEKGALVNPRFPPAQNVIIAARVRLGQVSQAKAAAARLLEIEPRLTVTGYAKTLLGAGVSPERVEALCSSLHEAGLPG